MQKILLLLLLNFLYLLSYADKQTQAEDLINDAIQVLNETEDYKKANVIFDKAYKIDPNFNYKSKILYAYCLYSDLRYKDALTLYQSLDEKYLDEESTYNLASIYLKLADYVNALNYYQRVIDYGGVLAFDALLGKNTCIWAIENEDIGKSKLTKLNYNLPKEFLGYCFWNKRSLIIPYDNADGKQVLGKSNFNSKYIQPPKLLDPKFSSPFNIGAPTITQTEPRVMYFTMFKESRDRCRHLSTCLQIFESKFENNSWSVPEPFSFNAADDAQNGHSVGFPSISKDGEIIFFSSDIKGGVGETDIYVSVKRGASWSLPRLVPGINSPKSELYPFYDDKSNRLYFSSNGLVGFGGFDLFYVDFDESGRPKTKPINLKKPINSSLDDYAFNLNPSNDKKALMASNRNQANKFELFLIELDSIPKNNDVNLVIIEPELNIPPEKQEVVIPNPLSDMELDFNESVLSNSLEDYEDINSIDLSYLEDPVAQRKKERLRKQKQANIRERNKKQARRKINYPEISMTSSIAGDESVMIKKSDVDDFDDFDDEEQSGTQFFNEIKSTSEVVAQKTPVRVPKESKIRKRKVMYVEDQTYDTYKVDEAVSVRKRKPPKKVVLEEELEDEDGNIYTKVYPQKTSKKEKPVLVQKQSPKRKKYRNPVKKIVKSYVQRSSDGSKFREVEIKLRGPLIAKLFFKKKTLILNNGAGKVLEKLANYLKQKTHSKIRIIGHTDTYGTEAQNKYLSWQRATKVRNYLVYNYDLDIKKIKVSGAGEDNSYLHGKLSSLIQDREHAKQRRVDIYLE